MVYKQKMNGDTVVLTRGRCSFAGGPADRKMKFAAVCTAFQLLALCYSHKDHSSEHHVGSQKHEEIKKLSPNEQKKKLVEIVKKIDIDSDKQLSAEEITQWIQLVYRQYALEDAEERFPKFDTNKDGVISWGEYNMFVHEHPFDDEEQKAVEGPEEESLRFLHLKEKRRFEFADADGIPGLNLTEFLAFTHPSEVDHMADYTIEDVLYEYDKNKDGLISLQEFLGDIRTNADDKPSQWEIDETIRFKDLYDQDKDGQLNREEQLRWVTPNSYASAREEFVVQQKQLAFPFPAIRWQQNKPSNCGVGLDKFSSVPQCLLTD
ncbi:reticulocalbin-2 isoform X3 [Scleropages formosus]|uniref:reticulocalbin-2 isoform X3 n=1 Tax=Scleropages formosus TaxID=113540 RepID=UPI0008781104|nr:reticulocalbin-2 isoform X3 [Scleropages formosus]